jgi:hypothetical protein
MSGNLLLNRTRGDQPRGEAEVRLYVIQDIVLVWAAYFPICDQGRRRSYLCDIDPSQGNKACLLDGSRRGTLAHGIRGRHALGYSRKSFCNRDANMRQPRTTSSSHFLPWVAQPISGPTGPSDSQLTTAEVVYSPDITTFARAMRNLRKGCTPKVCRGQSAQHQGVLNYR